MPADESSSQGSSSSAAGRGRPTPLTNEEVEAYIEGWCRLQVKLIPSKHFQKQGQARNITVADAKDILTRGRVVGNPEWNDNFGDWTYAVRGMDVEGDELEIRIGILRDREAIVLVTAYEPN
jgi:hypothetical protein